MLLANDASPFEMNAQMRIALDEATAGDHAEVVTAIRLAGEAKVKVNQATRCVASRAACSWQVCGQAHIDG